MKRRKKIDRNRERQRQRERERERDRQTDRQTERVGERGLRKEGDGPRMLRVKRESSV